MANPNHYETLDINPSATQAEIKQAYRQLVKRFHPDSNPTTAGHERIVDINAAYEILGDPERRKTYDRQLRWDANTLLSGFSTEVPTATREQRTADAQYRHRQRQTGRDSDEHFKVWINRVYQPTNRLLRAIINPLSEQIDALAADPFDDELMDDFLAYLDDCRDLLQRAQQSFRSIPNPSSVAGVAAHLYYCLNQVGDGLDELERFTSSFNEQYLHTGQELFRIARGLQREAQAAMREVKQTV